ncbi:MAG: type II toxin-antitoxin system RelE family toxin [Cytophagales bacterium]
MKFEIGKSFQKDFKKLSNRSLALSILAAIDVVAKAERLSDVPNVKKLSGFKNAYRIRVGGYRIGFFLENNTVIFQAFGNRKDIYKSFP